MIKRIVRRVIPKRLMRSIRAYFRDEARHKRERIEEQIPKVPLSEKHVRNCTILLDRATMLTKLMKGGTVAELGVYMGAFTECIIETTEPALLHLIDAWGSDRYHSGLFEEVMDRFADAIDSGRIKMHRKLSVDAAQDFPDDYFDWVYVDTSHSYETTKEELLAYAPKVKSDGIIAGHDYSMGNWVRGCRYGVIEAVHEFCVEHGWELVYLTAEVTENRSFALRRIRHSSAADG